MLLGCIADDFTGATDLANTLTRRGMHTVQMIGVPDQPAPAAEAVVVALKSRTIPACDAVEQSLSACRWLRACGARQIFFKYCSTFDSTDAGNIGPVADALLDELGVNFTIACPAFPQNGRTVYLGHLFTGRELLSDSGMRNHPLTPMLDANLVRVLARQTPHMVDLVPYATVKKGSAAVLDACENLKACGVRHAIVDAIEDTDLDTIGEACEKLVLVTGGSGAASGLPNNFKRIGLLRERLGEPCLPAAGGYAAVLAGSCSPATLAQVDSMKHLFPSHNLDVERLTAGTEAVTNEILAWAGAHLPKTPVLIYASVPPLEIAAIQARFGRDRSGAIVETAMARIACRLAAAGVRRFIVAGGETSGAVVKALDISALEIGPQIEPGIPVTLSMGSPRIALVLKSGNFGSPDFFLKALERMN